jgi:hypothetical protein
MVAIAIIIKRVGRSAFLRAAAELYLAARRRRDTDAALRRAYRSEADEMLDEISDIMSLQSWPKR